MLFIWTNDNLNVNKKRNHLREGALTFSNDCAEKIFYFNRRSVGNRDFPE